MEKLIVKNITGINKKWFSTKVKLVTLLYYSKELIKGEIKLKLFIRILRRLLFFLSNMRHNKYVRIGRKVKINLYVPAFPSKAFFVATKKVTEFEGKMPSVTALVSITSACKYRCEHCYQKFDKGKDIDIDILINVVKKLQDKGLAFFNIEGGEPFLVFDRLKKICKAIDERSEILINSTGYGMTIEKLTELRKHKNIISIMFSLHTHKPEELNSFMGVEDAWDNLVKGIEICHKTGMAVTFNSCLQRNEFYDGTFEKLVETATEFKAAIIQLIKPKPAGGWLDTGASTFTEEDLEFIKAKVNKYNLDNKYKNSTFISAMILEEDKSMFGCTAGGTDRFYINAKGDLQPCEFLNISFGNIKTDDFDTIYNNMRTQFEEPGDCWLCEKYSGEISKVFRDNNLKTLPLPPDLSEKIYKNWQRGVSAEFYENITKI